jgi:hypothetical protein
MNKDELFELRFENSQPFDNPIRLEEFVRDVIGNPLEIPVVAGYDRHQQYWEVWELSPSSISDELTVRNFLGGLEVIKETYGMTPNRFKNFQGELSYFGLENGDVSEYDSPILSIVLGNNGSELKTIKPPRFSLNIYYGRDKTYTAKSGERVSFFDEAMRKYLGPCLKND